VARLWGLQKNNATMNYTKMARALRYYDENKIITKCQENLQYKFCEAILKYCLFRVVD